MSGPKSSSYTLSAQQRAILLEQQRRERERELERQRLERERELERKRYQQESDRCSKLEAEIIRQVSTVRRHMSRIDQLLKESGRSSAEADRIKAESQKAEFALKRLRTEKPSTSGDLKRLNAELQTVLSSVDSSGAEAQKLSASLGEPYKQELAAIIQSGFSLSFEGIGASRKQENEHLKRINEILSGIDPGIPTPLQERFQRIRRQADEITNCDYLENFCAVVVMPFVKECQECADYEEVNARYRMLAAEAHVSTDFFECSVEGIRAMKEASEKLEVEILADRERSYIQAALDDAMREMGYELVGNRIQVKRTGKRIRHELYSLSDGTAVDVTFANNGQISMELGGIGTADRVPSSEESEQLVEDMRNFCKDYDILEKKLAERGIMTTRISHMPPAVEYAQIFNAGEYKMKKPVEMFHTEKRQKTNQQSVKVNAAR